MDKNLTACIVLTFVIANNATASTTRLLKKEELVTLWIGYRN
jgi:hypothetical protein